MPLNVGVIGLGNIGGGVSRNLAARGFAPLGYDIRPERIDAAQAEPADDAAAIGEQADVAVLAVASMPAWRASLAALAAHGRRGLIVADLCTFPIEDKETAREQLAGAGVTLLDCPVSGARPQAEAGTLSMLVGGDRDAFARALPAFQAFCGSVRHVGGFANASRIKYVLNLMISIHNMAAAEAFLLARKSGIDLRLLAEAVSDSAAQSRIFDIRAEKWITGDYADPTAELAIQLKDKDVIRDFAAGLACPTPMFDAAMPYYIAAAARGHTNDDAAAILDVLEAMAGIERDPPARNED